MAHVTGSRTIPGRLDVAVRLAYQAPGGVERTMRDPSEHKTALGRLSVVANLLSEVDKRYARGDTFEEMADDGTIAAVDNAYHRAMEAHEGLGDTDLLSTIEDDWQRWNALVERRLA